LCAESRIYAKKKVIIIINVIARSPADSRAPTKRPQLASN